MKVYVLSAEDAGKLWHLVSIAVPRLYETACGVMVWSVEVVSVLHRGKNHDLDGDRTAFREFLGRVGHPGKDEKFCAACSRFEDLGDL